MPPRHVNKLFYKNYRRGLEIRVQDGEAHNRALIQLFIQRNFSVDITNVPYTLWFVDNLGNSVQINPLHTIKSAFDVVRTDLNGQRSVCVYLWHHQHDLKPSNWTFKDVEVKEENGLAFSPVRSGRDNPD